MIKVLKLSHEFCTSFISSSKVAILICFYSVKTQTDFIGANMFRNVYRMNIFSIFATAFARMNKGIIIGIGWLILAALTGCNNSQRNLPADVVTNPNTANGEATNDLPVIEFEKEIHDFGKLVSGERVTYGFKFKNVGKSDLVISQVKTSCGCTVPQFSRKPIKPGEEQVLKVTFDSKGRKGIQNKTITILSNCQPSTTVIRIKAMVIAT
jgi:hypothetical protein